MNLTILTPEKELYSGSVRSVKVPGSGGQFEVLSGHAPIVSSLDKGTVRVVDTNGDRKEYAIEKGFIEVLHNDVSVLVTQADAPSE
ncbi:MAG: ATP synthase F1 subunit epsilon [Saprospiraceae bacterium]|nr:ATP synthase F1 subunit epsilon [Saprospiraceae bacterium]